MYKKILLPLDGSEQAETVLPHARALAESTGAELVLLRVSDRRPSGSLFIRPERIPTEKQDDSLKLLMQGYLNRIAMELRAGRVRVTTALTDGPATEAILRGAQDLHADVIVMSAFGETGPAPWLRDNTTQEVTRRAPVPVLLIGGKSEREHSRLSHRTTLRN